MSATLTAFRFFEKGDISENIVSGSKTAIYINNDNITKAHITWTNVTAQSVTAVRLKDEEKSYADTRP